MAPTLPMLPALHTLLSVYKHSLTTGALSGYRQKFLNQGHMDRK